MKRSNKDLKSLLSPNQEKTYMVSLLNSHEFKVVLRRYGRVFTRILFPKSKAQSRLQMLTKFGDMLLRLTKHHGPVFVVKYLKALTVALQRFIGGQPLSSLREIEPDLPLPRLASCGLPSFIPLRERWELKRLTPSVVRWWLTIFSVYRIISIPGKLKLETITRPYGGDKVVLSQTCAWLLENSKQLVSLFVTHFNPKASLGLEHILKASPSSKVSWKGFLMDAEMWKGRTEFFTFANFGQFSLYFDWYNLIKSGYPAKVPVDAVKAGRQPDTPCPLGQLSLKEESAGKIRVFAMVDVWTQSVLKPLHNWLFDLFRLLPNDSTHNQDTGFLRAKDKANYYGHAWCFDLSAATDRLPIQLQSAILDSLFGHIENSGYDSGKSYGQAWADLLVKREYFLPAKETSTLSVSETWLKYSVGQPMGAYSSWAMLNLCHHLILQYICSQIYGLGKWYECYEVLGDDIVIFDRKVADRYLELMEKQLDVACNQSKSLIAPTRPVIEFAKRVSIGQDEVSAFSWRQLRSFDSLFGRAAVAADIVSRRGVRSPLRAFKAITGPSWGPIPSYQYSLISFVGILVNRGVMSFKEVADILVDPKNPLRFIGGRIIANVRVGLLESIMIAYSKSRDLPKAKIDYQGLGRLLQLNQAAARGYLEDRIVDLYKLLHKTQKSYLKECNQVIGDLVPEFVISSLFYPGVKYLTPVKLVDLNTLSFEELVERVDKLEQLHREFTFYKASVTRKLVLEDSFKLLKLIMKSRRHGSLSFETSKFI